MKSTRDSKQTEKDKQPKPATRKRSVGFQFLNSMFSFAGELGERAGVSSFNATNKLLRTIGYDPRKHGGDDEMTIPGLVARVVPGLVVGTAALVVSPLYATGVQVSRFKNGLSQENIVWMQIYGVALINYCDADQLNAIGLCMSQTYQPTKTTSSNSSKVIAEALGFEKVEFTDSQRGIYTVTGYGGFYGWESDPRERLAQKKDKCINYIRNDLANNGKAGYDALYTALKLLHPKTHLERFVNPFVSNLVLEYLFEDFKFYKDAPNVESVMPNTNKP